MARPTVDELKKKIFELLMEKDLNADALYLAVRKSFSQTIDDLYSDRWIREIDLRRATSELIDERKIYFLANRDFSLSPKDKYASSDPASNEVYWHKFPVRLTGSGVASLKKRDAFAQDLILKVFSANLSLSTEFSERGEIYRKCDFIINSRNVTVVFQINHASRELQIILVVRKFTTVLETLEKEGSL